MAKITIEIDDEYAIGLIKAALGHSYNSNINIERSNIKNYILSKLETLKDLYNITHEEIFSEISFNFLRKSILYRKFDFDKGSITTFILHYVFNELRNIERKCKRGTFMKDTKKSDAMDLVMEDVLNYILDEFTNKLEDGVDYDNPENILLAKETFEAMKKYFTEDEMNNISSGNADDKLKYKMKKFEEANIE